MFTKMDILLNAVEQRWAKLNMNTIKILYTMSAQSEQHQQRPILRSFNFDSHPNGCEAKHCSYLVHLWTLCMKMPQWTEHHPSWPIYCVANNVSATKAASECTISSGPSSAHFSQTLNTAELICRLCLFRSNINCKAVWSQKLNMFFTSGRTSPASNDSRIFFSSTDPTDSSEPISFLWKRIKIHNWERHNT